MGLYAEMESVVAHPSGSGRLRRVFERLHEWNECECLFRESPLETHRMLRTLLVCSQSTLPLPGAGPQSLPA